MIPKRFPNYFPLPILLLLHSLTAAGQNVVFTAEAEATKIGLNDQVQVQYTIRDVQDLKGIGNDKFKDFRVVGGPFQSQSSNVSIVGNRMIQTTSLSFTYVLQPLHTGTLTVPAGYAKDGAGHSYQSNTFNIQVVPGTILAQQRRQQAQQSDPWGDDANDPMMLALYDGSSGT